MYLPQEKFPLNAFRSPEGKFQVAVVRPGILNYAEICLAALEKSFAQVVGKNSLIEKNPNTVIVLMATGKLSKLEAAQDMFQTASPLKTQMLIEALHEHRFSAHKEPEFSSAVAVALYKATIAKNEDSHIGVGADVVAAVWDPKQENWQLMKKLERLGRPLEADEWATEIKRLRELYVSSQRLSVTWEVAMAAVNGATSVASARIYVDATPFSEDEFRVFIQHAVQTGLWYTSNARGALFEMLMQFRKIKRIAVIPGWEFEKGKRIHVRDWMREPNPFLLNKVLHMILTTSPHGIHEL